ncbi:MAG: elongation factor P hydroxylase [Pseudoalteromonas rhizosphaerae]|jgi:elongation factor P hydroxylase|uniref:Elongation factor P hydroxylase n=1 Tax=Pseudoalteromonas neustonica TaxID=1840331 RepID=A0ABY3FAP2_9GAMM|nr:MULTISPECIES: elongation factor P hydroxylase [Pseudoalteromonas]MBB1293754.1 elongation factor P hydroxylase [Pseudoalteromonas sp. SR41-4]TVU81624.1 elongation factor P hydroxylase [Pseudoalteromonas neustonica]
MHQIADLTSIFERTFYHSHNTRLVKGEHEPIYIPADVKTPYHQIVFAHGFYASALHEIAHWLVAGDKRRLLEDYGYWYCPDGRDKAQQAEFEAVEVKPQAIEWALSVATGFEFNVSVDNLNGEQTCRFDFQARVHKQLLQLLKIGFNPRTTALLKALSEFYNTPWPLNAGLFVWQHPQELSNAV